MSLPAFVRLASRHSREKANGRRRGVWPHVEGLDERCLLSTIIVTTTGDNGNNTTPTPGSLRAAILQSDQGTQGSTIDFNIPTTDPGYNATTGVWTIAVPSALPTISTNAARSMAIASQVQAKTRSRRPTTRS